MYNFRTEPKHQTKKESENVNKSVSQSEYLYVHVYFWHRTEQCPIGRQKLESAKMWRADGRHKR